MEPLFKQGPVQTLMPAEAPYMGEREATPSYSFLPPGWQQPREEGQSQGRSSGVQEAVWHMSQLGLTNPIDHPMPPLQPTAGLTLPTGLAPPMLSMEVGPYPERPGEPECMYYMRTGQCGYGMTCRYHHPLSRSKEAARDAELPERPGQPECQYYLKTGSCKFGVSCKYHHNREKAGIAKVTLSPMGLPMRANEKDCAFYLRTGSCRYGVTCKFNHPMSTFPPPPYGTLTAGPVQASGTIAVPIPTLPGYPPRGTRPLALPNTLGGYIFSPSSAGGGLGLYPQVTDASGHPLPFVTSLTGYPPFLAPMHVGGPGMVSPTLQRSEGVFPERPGQPDCQYYVKTGDCKYGATCRYNHPKDRSLPPPSCILSPMGLPLRPECPSCPFYERYGICKFGPTCKFHHPMPPLTLAPPAPPHATGELGTLSTYLGPEAEAPARKESNGHPETPSPASEVHESSSGGS